MTPEEKRQLQELKDKVFELSKKLEEKEIRQITYPIDTQSIQALSQALIPATLNKVSADYGNMKQLALGSGSTVALTIASGAIRVTESVHEIETEGAAASDDLDTISSADVGDGQILVLSAASSSRTVVLKDGTGNLRLASDFSMDHSRDRIMLIKRATTWYELSRSDNDT